MHNLSSLNWGGIVASAVILGTIPGLEFAGWWIRRRNRLAATSHPRVNATRTAKPRFFAPRRAPAPVAK